MYYISSIGRTNHCGYKSQELQGNWIKELVVLDAVRAWLLEEGTLYEDLEDGVRVHETTTLAGYPVLCTIQQTHAEKYERLAWKTKAFFFNSLATLDAIAPSPPLRLYMIGTTSRAIDFISLRT